ncbi:MAG: preprotein translocase subunit SecG [Bacteroidota bacterium]
MLFLQILLVIVAIATTVIVAVQPSKGEGLGSIGGGGQLFFARNKNFEQFLEKLTAWLGGALFVLAIVLGILEGF